VQLRHLVLRERFGWKQIQCARRGILQDAIQNRQVVAERLPGRRWRGDHHLPTIDDVVERFGLVGVELMHAALLERGCQPWIEAFWKRRISGLDGRQPPHRGHDLVGRIGPVERGTGRQHGQRALEGNVFGFLCPSHRQRRLSTLLEATLSLSKGRAICRHR
jgi:hypothetical protein